MKCPFRTVVTKEIKLGTDPFSPTYGKVVREIETSDFSECIGEECPFFKYSVEMSEYGEERVPKCMRVEV